MRRNTIEMLFADGAYTFALPAPRIEELQRKTGIGIGELPPRLWAGLNVVGQKVIVDPNATKFHYADIVETIRQALIGGGTGVVNGEEVKVTPAVAERLLQSYVFTQPIGEYQSLAATVVTACVHGYEPPKKDEPAPKAGAPKKSKKAGSTTASS